MSDENSQRKSVRKLRTPTRKSKDGSLSRRLMLTGVACAAVGGVGLYARQVLTAEPKKLSLAEYRMTFSEEFDDPDFSIEHFMTRWYPHTPWWGDFGDAVFSDPVPGFPFTTHEGHLRIEASKDNAGKWRSGLISSIDRDGKGFAQQYGYFEMRAKLPPGPGVWPAFWLNSSMSRDSLDPAVEIDVLEYYGQFPKDIHSTVIIWPKGGVKASAAANIHKVPDMRLSESFHTYGVSVEPDWIIMYFDGEETWRTPTPDQHKYPLMVLCNLALGSGWPIDKTINPSYLYIDHIRVYEKIVPSKAS